MRLRMAECLGCGRQRTVGATREYFRFHRFPEIVGSHRLQFGRKVIRLRARVNHELVGVVTNNSR